MRRFAYGAVLVLLVVAVACGSGEGRRPSTGSATPPGSAASAPGPGRAAAYRPTYHGGNDRAGSVAGFPAPHTLGHGWSARLDGAVYGQPVVVGGTAYVGTENDTVFALDLATGRQ